MDYISTNIIEIIPMYSPEESDFVDSSFIIPEKTAHDALMRLIYIGDNDSVELF